MALPASGRSFEQATKEPTLRLVEDPARPPRLPRALLLVAFLAVIGILGTAGGVFAWQHNQVSDRSTALTAARQQVQTLTARSRALQDQIGTLQGRFDTLTVKERSLASELHAVQGRRAELATELRATRAQRDAVSGQLQQAKDQLGATRTQLASLRASTTTMVGASLRDGRYIGRIFGAVAFTTPPRVAVTITQDIDGQAISSPGWRLFRVEDGTTVRLLTWRSTGPITVSFASFAELFNDGRRADASVHVQRYLFTLDRGQVSHIVEYQLP